MVLCVVLPQLLCLRPLLRLWTWHLPPVGHALIFAVLQLLLMMLCVVMPQLLCLRPLPRLWARHLPPVGHTLMSAPLQLLRTGL